jgi:predicted SAM-dependent methyltransferase
MDNNEFNELLGKSKFFKSLNYIPKKNSQEYVGNSDLVKINIAAGPNIFPYKGWTNYDHVSFESYFDWAKNTNLEPGTIWANDGPGSFENMNKLQKFLRSNDTSYILHDIRKGLTSENDSVDLIYFGQAIEHFNPIFEVPKILKECYRVMKPGGVIRVTTPDLDLLIQSYFTKKMDIFNRDQPEFYIESDPGSQLSFLMFGASGPNCTFDNYEGHMCLYTRTSMKKILEDAGFKDIEFYIESGKSKNITMQKEAIDAGVNHSLIVEAVK